MLDTEVLHAMSDDEKMEEDKEETRNEEIEHEEQEEHQKTRAIASLDIPSRREVAHIPF